jgi:hypothetical protein
MCLASCQLGGSSIAVPNTCRAPVAPVPLINKADGMMAVPSQGKVLYKCTPAHNRATVNPFSMLDTPGVGLGVKVPLVMGPAWYTSSGKKVILGGALSVRLSDQQDQNGGNAPGRRMIPSQYNILHP